MAKIKVSFVFLTSDCYSALSVLSVITFVSNGVQEKATTYATDGLLGPKYVTLPKKTRLSSPFGDSQLTAFRELISPTKVKGNRA